MNYQVKDFGYSTKNIPLANKSKYLQTLIEKTQSLIHRMRWKAFFFLQNHDTTSNDKETYGFKSKRAPPGRVENTDPQSADYPTDYSTDYPTDYSADYSTDYSTDYPYGLP